MPQALRLHSAKYLSRLASDDDDEDNLTLPLRDGSISSRCSISSTSPSFDQTAATIGVAMAAARIISKRSHGDGLSMGPESVGGSERKETEYNLGLFTNPSAVFKST